MGVDEHGLGMVTSLGVGARLEKQLHAQICRESVQPMEERPWCNSARIPQMELSLSK